MKEIKAVGVYCSSYNHLNPIYIEAAEDLGKELAHRGITMVYGGGAEGLMGAVARATIAHDGSVIGFMPKHLELSEPPNQEITELHMVDTMHTRKRLMFERSDAFVILPGGFGTLDETFELITWRQLNLHEKPIIFVNINNYWSSLRDLTSNIFTQHFAKEEDKKCFHFVNSVAETFQALLKEPEPMPPEPVEKWV